MSHIELINEHLRKLGLKEMDSSQENRLILYIKELLLWNQKINLIGKRTEEGVLRELLLPSYLYIPELPEEEGLRVLDLGSGGGIPGIPIKIYNPALRFSLVESNKKKGLFLTHMVKLLEIRETEVLIESGEALAHHKGRREGYHILISRAFGALNVLVELGLPFLKIGGRLISLKKREEKIEDAIGVIKLLGGELKKAEEVGGMKMVVLEKVSRSPDKYPRKAGIPRKRPLR